MKSYISYEYEYYMADQIKVNYEGTVRTLESRVSRRTPRQRNPIYCTKKPYVNSKINRGDRQEQLQTLVPSSEASSLKGIPSLRASS